MQYHVRFVDEDSLPEGVPWAFVRTPRAVYLFMKQGCIDPTSGRCQALSRAWQVWQESQSVQLEKTPGRLQGGAHPFNVGGLVAVGGLHL